MTSFTVRNGGWIRKTTATGLVLLLLVQVSIALLFVPQTLKAGTEIRRELAWKELSLLKGEPNVTITLYEGALSGAKWSRYRSTASISIASPWPPMQNVTLGIPTP